LRQADLAIAVIRLTETLGAAALGSIERSGVPQQEAGGSGGNCGVDLGTYLHRAVRHATCGKVLQPGNDRGTAPSDHGVEVSDARPDDVGRLTTWIGDVVLARPPVRRVDHRGHVVDVRREQANVLGDLLRTGGGDPEHRDSEQGVSVRQLGLGVGDEAGHSDVRSALQAREVHRCRVALRPARVVEEDLVESQLRRLDRQVDQILADFRTGDVGERGGPVVGLQRTARAL
jgi:hypothetical protein